MASRVRSAVNFVRAIANTVRTERLQLTAGGIAYFTVLSVVPLLIAFASIAGIFLGTQDVERTVQSIVRALPGIDEQTITQILNSIAGGESQTAFTIATITSIIVGVFAASRVVVGMRMALDAIFGVPVMRSTILPRLLAAVAALVGLLLATLGAVALTVVPTVVRSLGLNVDHLPVLNWILALVITGVVLRLMYRYGAHQRMTVPWFAPGVWFAAVWIMAVTSLLGLYVSSSTSMNAAVAALGAPIVILLWVYLVAFGTFLGATIVTANNEALPAVSGTSGAGRSPGR